MPALVTTGRDVAAYFSSVVGVLVPVGVAFLSGEVETWYGLDSAVSLHGRKNLARMLWNGTTSTKVFVAAFVPLIIAALVDLTTFVLVTLHRAVTSLVTSKDDNKPLFPPSSSSCSPIEELTSEHCTLS